MIASGGLSGGISSAIAGGNFWDGVRQGLITSGLNHAAHGMLKGGKPPREREKTNQQYNEEYATAVEELKGKPYVRGKDGPDAADCSGAVCYGINKVKDVNINQTAHDLFKQYTVTSDVKTRGSLIFYDYTSDGTIDHVTTVLSLTEILHPSSSVGIIQIKPMNYLHSYTIKQGGVMYYREINWQLITNQTK